MKTNNRNYIYIIYYYLIVIIAYDTWENGAVSRFKNITIPGLKDGSATICQSIKAKRAFLDILHQINIESH